MPLLGFPNVLLFLVYVGVKKEEEKTEKLSLSHTRQHTCFIFRIPLKKSALIGKGWAVRAEQVITM